MMLTAFILFDLLALITAGRIAPAAKRLLERMNADADPCEDFYEFACGNYVKNNVIPDNKSGKSIFSDHDDMNNRRLAAALSKPIRRRDIKAVRKAKIFYRSCIHNDFTTSIQSALDYLNSVGGTWPTFDPTWTDAQFDLESSLAAATKLDSFDPSGTVLGPFIRMWVFRDFFNGDEAITFFRPNFLVSDIFLTPEVIAEMEQLIIDTLILLGADPATAMADGQAILAFELDLQSVSGGQLATVTIDIIQAVLPYINWLDYLNQVFEEVDITLDGNEEVLFQNLNYFIALEGLLNAASTRTVANVIKWTMFTMMVPVMPDSIRSIFLRLSTLMNGVEALPDRRTTCVRIVNGNLPGVATNYGMVQATARLFVECYLSKTIKRKNERIGAKIKTTIQDAMRNSDWLSAETKATLNSKLDKEIEEFVYPETTFNDDYLNNFYRDYKRKMQEFGLLIDEAIRSTEQTNFDIQKEKLVENFISSALGNTRRTLEMLINQERNKWTIPASITNAYSSFPNNQIVLTASFLQPDGAWFDLSYPLAVNFAGAGFFVGHEILHTIGPGGLAFDEDGLLVGNIYSGPSSTEFMDRAFCLIDQYAQYDVPFTDGPAMVNGFMTIGESMADEVGLKFAYLTYDTLVTMKGEEKLTKVPFTARQLFFIDYAQSFCEILRPKRAENLAIINRYPPGKWRTNGPLRNLPEFAEVFNCPAGSFMNPTDKCTVF